MNPTILTPAVVKYWSVMGSLTLVWLLVLEKENWIQTSFTRGKKDGLYLAVPAQDMLHE